MEQSPKPTRHYTLVKLPLAPYSLLTTLYGYLSGFPVPYQEVFRDLLEK